MFYLGFPIVCRVVRPTMGIVMVLAGFVVLGPFARTVLGGDNLLWRDYSYLGSMDAIALGCLTALVTAGTTFSPRALRVLSIAGAALLIFGLGPVPRPVVVRLGRSGLDMSLLALGACLLIAGTTQTGWKAPRLLSPLLQLGRRSYEVYLTHMFVVFALFRLFQAAGSSMAAIPVLFVAVVAASGVLGEIVARRFSEPLNRAIRDRWHAEPERTSNVR
jgi:peptidoglycan/LPS O-acetylase OafA/YrhL